METILRSLKLPNDENQVFIPFAPSFIDRYGPTTNNTSVCWYGVKWCNLHLRLQFDPICGDKWKFCLFFQKVLNQKKCKIILKFFIKSHIFGENPISPHVADQVKKPSAWGNFPPPPPTKKKRKGAIFSDFRLRSSPYIFLRSTIQFLIDSWYFGPTEKLFWASYAPKTWKVDLQIT